MLKKLSVFLIITVMIFSVSACKKDNHAKFLFDELGFSAETLSSWAGEIKYINENRGSFEDTYAKVKYNPDDPLKLLSLINCFEGAQVTEAPDDFVFSAEGMSEYIVNFYIDGAETPALSFYYWSEGNLLTRAIHTLDEETQAEYIDYEFYTPYGDLKAIMTQYRELAIEPETHENRLSLNQKQLIAAVQEEELEERMTYYDDEYEVQANAEMGEIEFEIFDGTLPEDNGTGCKLYDNGDIPELTDEQLVLMARIADEKGEPMKLQISFIEYNSNYTIVTVTKPDATLMEELGLEVDNAVIVNRQDIIQDINEIKRIVFLDDEGTVLYVIVPFAN